MCKFLDVTGQRFGKLTAHKLIGRDKGKTWWEFLCDCGNLHKATLSDARTGNTRSCGCMKKGVNKSHGMCRTKEYRAWCAIKYRCYAKNPSERNKKSYSDKGITVCDRWINSFENFLDDMGFAPSKDHTIERKDVNGNYSPENCCWATWTEQQRNKTNNVIYEIDGIKKPLSAWCEDYGLTLSKVSGRIKLGWDIKRALEITEGAKYRIGGAGKSEVIFIDVDGVSKTLMQWCDEMGLRRGRVYARLYKLKWPIKQALGIEPRVQGEKRP